jgi:L-ascorbate metabolism protein UlaG (beta-lactamase superfamily)
MQLQLVRSATLRIDYAGHNLLIDPMLSVRNAIRPMGDAPERNPIVELPFPTEQVLDGVTTVICSHLHPDHWDDAATGLIPRSLPLICQPADTERFVAIGFEPTTLESPTRVGHMQISPTGGIHGSGDVAEKMGSVMGLVLRADGEPTVYWVGDTVLCDEVREVISKEQPDVVITHSGGARYGGVTILMDIDETIEVAQLAPDATVVAVHLEAVAHAPVTRSGLRAAADAAGIGSDRLLIPADGETIRL